MRNAALNFDAVLVMAASPFDRGRRAAPPAIGRVRQRARCRRMRSATLRKNPMKATIFLATALGIAIAGAALQAQAAPARIAEFGAAPEITLVAQAKISRAKPKVEAIKRKRSRSRSSRCFGGICPLVGSGDY